jgi:peptidoglycan LD-endopeptidase LytH
MKKWVRRIVLGAAGLWLLMLLVTHPTAWALLRWSASPKEMIVPVSGVTPSSLTGSFGAPRSEHRKHAGIDIFARRGTRVLAAAPGKVIRVGHNRLGGKVVWVAGAGAQLYYYAHLDQFSVQRGDTVRRAIRSAASATPATPRPRRRICTSRSIRCAAPFAPSIPLRS